MGQAGDKVALITDGRFSGGTYGLVVVAPKLLLEERSAWFRATASLSMPTNLLQLNVDEAERSAGGQDEQT